MFQRNSHDSRSAWVILPFLALLLPCAVGCDPGFPTEAGSRTDKIPSVEVNLSADSLVPSADFMKSSPYAVIASSASNNIAINQPVINQPVGAVDQHPPLGQPTVPDDLELVSNDENEPEQTPAAYESAKKYTDGQLHKNLTTLVLAYQPDVRARHLLKFVRELLTPVQEDQALGILLQNDYHFQRLIQKRGDVLNEATDGDDTSEKLRQIKIETVELSNRMRSLVFKNVLTAEQKKRRQQVIEKSRLAKQIKAEKQKKR